MKMTSIVSSLLLVFSFFLTSKCTNFNWSDEMGRSTSTQSLGRNKTTTSSHTNEAMLRRPHDTDRDVGNCSRKQTSFRHLSMERNSFSYTDIVNFPSTSSSFDPCRDCTLTSFISATSNLKLWGDGVEYRNFQGACDTIAVDNDFLQLQIRIRPGRNTQWSGVVQLGLKWKDSGRILFLFDGSDGLVTNNVESHRDIVEYTVENKTIHIFQFITESENDNYIQIEELNYGLYSILIKGFGYTFRGSNGLLGSWNRWDKTPRVTLKDGSIYAGYNSHRIAKSWRVPLVDSILNDPSDICEMSYACGPGQELECVENMNEFDSHQRQSVGCLSSCNDIADPHMRLFCKEDVRLTGYNSFACQKAYAEPILKQSIPPPCPSDCSGDLTSESFKISGVLQKQTCMWAIFDPTKTRSRCDLPEVKTNCCESCCISCTGDAAGISEFEVPESNTRKTCQVVASEDLTYWCSLTSVSRMCCETCAKGLPSRVPSVVPSPSTIPSAVPSRIPSVIPNPSTAPTTTTMSPTTSPTIAPIMSPTVAPISGPNASPTYDCIDSTLRLKILDGTKSISRYCKWVGKKDTKNRCAMPGVAEACPVACESCATCEDSGLRFKFSYNGKIIIRGCKFVGNVPEKVHGRCLSSKNICRKTCGVC